jgi:thiamine kinase-like enzyme
MVAWQDAMAEVQEQVEQLAQIFPQLSSAAGPFLKRLRQLEAVIPPDHQVPSHGTFRPAQVLLYRGEIGFIDFDSFCQSEPANDLSLFFATVMRIGLTPSSLDKGKSPDQTIANPTIRQARFELLSSVCDQFLDVYERCQPISRQRLVLWEALNIFLYVLSAWMKNKADEISYLVDLLDRFLLASHVASKS